MKIRDTFILKTVAGENLVVPIGSKNISFNAVITLNESGKFLWNVLEKDTTTQNLVEALIGEYDVSREIAERDVEVFIRSLKENDILED